jgi:hypothetical protein
MKPYARTSLLLLLVCGLIQSQPSRQRMPEDVAVFAVERSAGSLTLDPVAVVHYGGDQRFKTIPSLNDSGKLVTFDKAFYTAGRKVSVFRGGEKLGEAIMRGADADNMNDGCVVQRAAISYAGPSTPLTATNTGNEIPGHAAKRRLASPAEVRTL